MNRKAKELSQAMLRRQRLQLAEWLAEWRLEQMLHNSELPGIDGAERKSDIAKAWSYEPREQTGCGPVGPDIASGQIRLIMPDHETTNARPLYVMILASWDQNEWLTTPFGMLATPAIPGEWRTGFRALPIRVLCIWNTRRVTRDRLQRSWHGRDMDSRRLAIARRLAADIFSWPTTVRQRLKAVTAASFVSPNTLGPPLVHPCDPRRQYIDSESERMDELGKIAAMPSGDRCRRGQPMPGSQISGIFYDLAANSYQLRKAAEPRSDYGTEP